MRRTHLPAVMAAATLLCACTTVGAPEAPKTRVSADYEAAGDVAGMRAFVYGKRTVLEFSGRALWLTVQDENGVPVSYEREGRYYRLARTLGRFTVRANTRVVVFNATVRQAAASAGPQPVPPDPAPPASRPVDAAPTLSPAATVSMKPAPEDGTTALLRLSTAQHDEVRRAIAGGAGAAEARVLNARLDRLKARLDAAAAVMIRIQFDRAATGFEADGEPGRALLAAARGAERIIVRGRTDARVAGREDWRIARGRALAVRRFLVGHGVNGGRIQVYSLAAGDFLAPAETDEGRALNRRVEIELVNRRHATSNQQPGALHGAAP